LLEQYEKETDFFSEPVFEISDVYLSPELRELKARIISDRNNDRKDFLYGD